MALVGTIVPDNTLSFRNRIINGDMRIDQRNAGAQINTENAAIFTVDRFFFLENAATTCTTQQVTDAPSGFSYSFKFTNSATTSTPDYGQLVQRIEGYNVADLEFGTSSAKNVTVSFWVKSSLTGTFSISLRNQDANRSNISTYTINSANTWEYKTVTFVGDTTGTWLKTNGNGLELIYRIAANSGSSTLNEWTATGDAFASGAVNVMGTANATWQITGVQLEAGSVATPFERRPYGTELSLCQRYFYRTIDPGANGVVAVSGASVSRLTFYPPVPMRASPTLFASGTFNFWNGAAVATSSSVAGVFKSSNTNGLYQLDFGSLSANMGADGRAVALYTLQTGTNYIDAAAEL